MYAKTMNVHGMELQSVGGQTLRAHVKARGRGINSVPVVDFSQLHKHSEARSLTIKDIGKACKTLGFFQDLHGMRNQFDRGMQVIATNFYPQSSEPNLEVGLDSHSDYGFITVLIQSCPGLQVKDQEEGTWRAIPHLPEALYVHVGDYMEVLSNGRYKSVIHRAILNPEKERISIASIHNLSIDEKVAPARGMVDERHPKKYRETSFRDFLNYLSTADTRIDELELKEFSANWRFEDRERGS